MVRKVPSFHGAHNARQPRRGTAHSFVAAAVAATQSDAALAQWDIASTSPARLLLGASCRGRWGKARVLRQEAGAGRRYRQISAPRKRAPRNCDGRPFRVQATKDVHPSSNRGRVCDRLGWVHAERGRFDFKLTNSYLRRCTRLPHSRRSKY